MSLCTKLAIASTRSRKPVLPCTSSCAFAVMAGSGLLRSFASNPDDVVLVRPVLPLVFDRSDCSDIHGRCIGAAGSAVAIKFEAFTGADLRLLVVLHGILPAVCTDAPYVQVAQLRGATEAC